MDWTHLGQVCLDALLPVLATVLTGVLTALAGLAIAYLRKKWGLQITAAQEDAIDAAILDGIEYAEEQARKRLKSGSGITTASDAKLDLAVTHAIMEMRRMGLPEMARDRIVALIEARIEQVRP